MTFNVGSADRVFRALLGVVILGWGLATGNWWGLIGIAPLATAVFRFCPGYLPFKFSTAKHTEHPAPSK